MKTTIVFIDVAKIIIFAVIVVALIWAGVWYSNKLDEKSKQEALALQEKIKTAQNEIMEKLIKEDVVVGTGDEAKSGDKITVNYEGTFMDGKKFDSSYDRKRPFEFVLGQGQVIQGWDLGVVGMRVGGKRKLTIPPELGYGESGSGPIPPSSTLKFTVELLSVGPVGTQ